MAKVSEQRCILGEGLFIGDSNCLLWVDIETKQLFFRSASQTAVFLLPEVASKVLAFDGVNVTLAAESGIAIYNLTANKWRLARSAPPLSWAGSGRSNDACVLPDGSILVGRMDNSPRPDTGDIVHYHAEGIDVVHMGFAIPNTFVHIPERESVLISDSLVNKTYECSISMLDVHKKLDPVAWQDFSSYGGTPDGGVLGTNGYVYITLWGRGLVAKVAQNGEVMETFSVRAKQPTSIQEDPKTGKFWVTSATLGLSAAELEDYPASGELTNLTMETN